MDFVDDILCSAHYYISLPVGSRAKEKIKKEMKNSCQKWLLPIATLRSRRRDRWKQTIQILDNCFDRFHVYSYRKQICQMSKSKITKTSTIIGCTLLIIMALFHGSGIFYVTDLIQQSDTEPFIKEIFPILFAHPSIQLLGLAGLGIVTLFMKYEIDKILVFIAILVFIDSILAFLLGATIPGVLLVFSSSAFVLGGIKSPK